MSSVYDQNLPHAFPFMVTIDMDHAREVVTHLLAVESRSDGLIDGSSFAVTVDARPGFAKVWLSKASYEYLSNDLALLEMT